MKYMIDDFLLCDSDFLISLQLETESTHLNALKIFEKYNNFLVLDIIFWEIATVLSRKLTHQQAILTLNLLQKTFIDVVEFTKEDEIETFKLFESFDKKNISFFDCANLHLAKKNNWKIASFDKFYPPEIRV